jgi:hypothetical protein
LFSNWVGVPREQPTSLFIKPPEGKSERQNFKRAFLPDITLPICLILPWHTFDKQKTFPKFQLNLEYENNQNFRGSFRLFLEQYGEWRDNICGLFIFPERSGSFNL